jgi:hypothetical protein
MEQKTPTQWTLIRNTTRILLILLVHLLGMRPACMTNESTVLNSENGEDLPVGLCLQVRTNWRAEKHQHLERASTGSGIRYCRRHDILLLSSILVLMLMH